MRISDEGLKEFINIAREDYGVRLSEAEARVYAVQALMLYELIHQPLPNELAFDRSSDPSRLPDDER